MTRLWNHYQFIMIKNVHVDGTMYSGPGALNVIVYAIYFCKTLQLNFVCPPWVYVPSSNSLLYTIVENTKYICVTNSLGTKKMRSLYSSRKFVLLNEEWTIIIRDHLFVISCCIQGLVLESFTHTVLWMLCVKYIEKIQFRLNNRMNITWACDTRFCKVS